DWLDLESWLRGQQKVTKQDLLSYIDAHAIQINEIRYASDYVPPGRSGPDREEAWREAVDINVGVWEQVEPDEEVIDELEDEEMPDALREVYEKNIVIEKRELTPQEVDARSLPLFGEEGRARPIVYQVYVNGTEHGEEFTSLNAALDWVEDNHGRELADSYITEEDAEEQARETARDRAEER